MLMSINKLLIKHHCSNMRVRVISLLKGVNPSLITSHLWRIICIQYCYPSVAIHSQTLINWASSLLSDV